MMRMGVSTRGILLQRQAVPFAGAFDAIPSIAAAYGMRRLRTAYTGNLLRMRRSSDNAESDFGYTAAGDLDTAAIVTWLGGSSGYITTWYDQSGNGYNATQTTAANQPLYVASGQNGRPVLRWDGVNDYFSLPNGTIPSNTAPYTVLIVSPYKREIRGWLGSGVTSPGLSNSFRANSSGSVYLHNYWFVNDYSSTDALVNNTWYVMVFRSSSGRSIFVNGTQQSGSGGTGSGGGSNLNQTLGASLPSVPPDQFWNSDIAELIIANAAWSTGDRQAAEAASNAYWAVY